MYVCRCGRVFMLIQTYIGQHTLPNLLGSGVHLDPHEVWRNYSAKFAGVGRTYVRTYVCIYVPMYVRTYVCMHVCMYCRVFMLVQTNIGQHTLPNLLGLGVCLDPNKHLMTHAFIKFFCGPASLSDPTMVAMQGAQACRLACHRDCGVGHDRHAEA